MSKPTGLDKARIITAARELMPRIDEVLKETVSHTDYSSFDDALDRSGGTGLLALQRAVQRTAEEGGWNVMAMLGRMGHNLICRECRHQNEGVIGEAVALAIAVLLTGYGIMIQAIEKGMDEELFAFGAAQRMHDPEPDPMAMLLKLLLSRT